MLKSLIEFKPGDTVTLIPNSGVQFLDFGFDRAAVARLSRGFAFVEDAAPGTVSIFPLEPGPDDSLVYRRPDGGGPITAHEDQIYQIGAGKVLDWLEGLWLPFPFFRRSGSGFDEGPTTWARVRLVRLDEPDEAGRTHRVVLAFDTLLTPRLPGQPYTAPEYDNDATEKVFFGFCSDHRRNSAFMALPWVAGWLKEQFIAGIRRDRRQADSLLPGEHWAAYMVLLDVIAATCPVPTVEFADIFSSYGRREPVGVSLVLDVGNSRMCGVLVEDAPGSSYADVSQTYRLELRDLSRIERVYSEPFESRVEFAATDFGPIQHASRSGRTTREAFWWPSPVRVGPEAARLAAKTDGTEGASGLSSPKRYLWDGAPRIQPWINNNANLPDGAEPQEYPRADDLAADRGRHRHHRPSRPAAGPGAPLRAVVALHAHARRAADPGRDPDQLDRRPQEPPELRLAAPAQADHPDPADGDAAQRAAHPAPARRGGAGAGLGGDGLERGDDPGAEAQGPARLGRGDLHPPRLAVQRDPAQVPRHPEGVLRPRRQRAAVRGRRQVRDPRREHRHRRRHHRPHDHAARDHAGHRDGDRAAPGVSRGLPPRRRRHPEAARRGLPARRARDRDDRGRGRARRGAAFRLLRRRPRGDEPARAGDARPARLPGARPGGHRPAPPLRARRDRRGRTGDDRRAPRRRRGRRPPRHRPLRGNRPPARRRRLRPARDPDRHGPRPHRGARHRPRRPDDPRSLRPRARLRLRRPAWCPAARPSTRSSSGRSSRACRSAPTASCRWAATASATGIPSAPATSASTTRRRRRSSARCSATRSARRSAT